MVEDAEATCAFDDAVAGCFCGFFGSNAGSGGGRDGLGVTRRFSTDFGDSAAEGMGCAGGEYCVPASTVGFGTEEVDRGRLFGFGSIAGE